MEIDPTTGGIAAVIAAVIGILFQRAARWLRDLVIDAACAAAERSRIRERRARRAFPAGRRAPSHPGPVAGEEFEREESTDIFELLELERAGRTKRKTDRQRSHGERPPRPGTHHDEG